MTSPIHSPFRSAGERDRLRLQKILAAAGVDSRRKCEDHVRDGRVTVDGEVVTDLATRADPNAQEIRLDGERIELEPVRTYLLNKPAGVVCTNRDPQRRPRAIDLVPQTRAKAHVRLFTVGRLDESSEGLLLVTNDGQLAQRLAHPRFQMPRVYRLQVAGTPSRETLAELKKGLYFTEGRFALHDARRVKSHGKSSFLEVELTGGQNREIRRLFARVGHKVIWLQRIAFGPIRLGDLARGKCRPLTHGEMNSLRGVVKGSPTARKGGSRSPRSRSQHRARPRRQR